MPPMVRSLTRMATRPPGTVQETKAHSFMRLATRHISNGEKKHAHAPVHKPTGYSVTGCDGLVDRVRKGMNDVANILGDVAKRRVTG